MFSPLLATKLFVPPPVKSLVIRPRLLEKLNGCLQPRCRLTLVSAPAGFGKTTLVSTWADGLKSLDDRPSPITAWLSLDEGDNNPVVFWSYIITALQAQNKGVGKRALTLLQSSQPPSQETIVSLLANDLVEIPGDLILVLDDFHLIRIPAIHQALFFLIDHLPPLSHVLILSRTDPPMPLALLRSRGQLLEVRQADLRFTNEEAVAYLNDQMKLSLTYEDVDTLNAKTEGWAAGIQMAGISLLGREDHSRFVQTFSGSNRYILDYLTDEILGHQTAKVQTFLLYTGILEQLSASLCVAVVGGSGDAQALLEQLEKANLFLVPLDQERHWYRYHHLFAEILRLKLSRSSPELVTVLQKRAAQWYEAEGMLEEAVYYTHAARDDDGLMRLIEKNVGPMRKKGRGIIIRGWAQLLPEELVLSRPWLCILSAWSHVSRSDVAGAEPFLDRAEQLVKEQELNENTREMLGTIYALRTEILHTRGDITGTLKMARQAVNLLDPADIGNLATVNYSLARAYYASGDLDRADQVCSDIISPPVNATVHGVYAIISGIHGTILAIKGKLREAVNTYRLAIDTMIANDIDQFFGSGNPYGGLGMMTYQRNGLEEAETLIDESLRHYQRWGILNAMAVGLSNRAIVRTARGNLEGALADTREAKQIIQGNKQYFDVSSIVLASSVRLYLAKGDIDALTLLIDEDKLRSDDPLTFQREQDHLSLCRVLIARSKLVEADGLLQRLAEDARAGCRFGRLIEILNLRAVALQGLGKTAEALQILETSLTLAEPEGYIRIFVDEGRVMATLLELAIRKGIYPVYAGSLLKAFDIPGQQEKQSKDIQKNNLGLLDPLSRREIEVLQLIAAGLINKEISQRLSISVRTVKYHTTNIYAKLEANGRMEAIVKARDLGLLI